MNAHSAPRFAAGARPLKMIKPINAAWVACVANAIILVFCRCTPCGERGKMKNEREGAGVNCAGGNDISNGGTLPDPDQNSNPLAPRVVWPRISSRPSARRWPQILRPGGPSHSSGALGLVTRQNVESTACAEQHDIDLAEYASIEQLVQVDLISQRTVRQNLLRSFTSSHRRRDLMAGGSRGRVERLAGGRRRPGTPAQRNEPITTSSDHRHPARCMVRGRIHRWTRLICRTGSPGHNAWCCERAQNLGFKWSPYEGFEFDDGTKEVITSEKMFYERLGLEFVPPHRRERSYLEHREGR